MRKRSNRGGNHQHEFRSHNVGADLQRQICTSCGRISIGPVAPRGLPEVGLEPGTGLFTATSVTVALAEALEPIVNRPRFGERRPRR